MKDRNNLKRIQWLTKRDRWASVMVDFDRNSVYKEHRVVWYEEEIGWLNSSGQSLEEAVDNAMKTKYSTETCEHWVED
jgi:hypothetical protein